MLALPEGVERFLWAAFVSFLPTPSVMRQAREIHVRQFLIIWIEVNSVPGDNFRV
jgi:hypothetical protein